MTRRWICPSLVAVLVLFGSGAAVAQCRGGERVLWPKVRPVWDFCYSRPSAHATANGDGLQIYNVKYRGVKVVKRADIPILNVQYEPGGCGGAKLCYRDWFWEESPFTCSPRTADGVCSGTLEPPETVCNHPGHDAGSFRGVAVWDRGTSLKLVAAAKAGWYRYIPTWEFSADGTLRAGIEITATDSECVAHTHRHHAYFRFDLDVVAPTRNFVDRVTAAGLVRIKTEAAFTDQGGARSRFRVGRLGSKATVDVWRNPEDGVAAGDPFAIGDAWVLRAKGGEVDDGPIDNSGEGDCRAGIGAFLNAEPVEASDLVLWMHAMTVHQGEPGGVAFDCSIIGPTLKVNLPR